MRGAGSARHRCRNAASHNFGGAGTRSGRIRHKLSTAEYPLSVFPGYYSAGAPAFYSAAGFAGNYFYPHNLGYTYSHPYYYTAGAFPQIVSVKEEIKAKE